MTNYEAYKKLVDLCKESISVEGALNELPKVTEEFDCAQTKAVQRVVELIKDEKTAKDMAIEELKKGNYSNAKAIVEALEFYDEPFFFIDDEFYCVNIRLNDLRFAFYDALGIGDEE